ncbi:unnamed protein product, partial [Coregonus sp. 'balchen']
MLLMPMSLCLSLSVLEARVQLEPRTITVLRGDPARLICSTAEPWQVMVWILNGGSVLTISAQYGILSNNPNVTAVNHRSTNQVSSWEFVLKRVQRSYQGQVTCDLQNIQRQTADLFVQERGNVAITEGNVTVLKGEEVLFQCLAVGWYPEPSLTWLLNSREVDQVISASRPAESSHVSVSDLPTLQASSVRLTVEVLVENVCDDCIVLIAVTASVSTVLLLLLLSICIVLCYRRRRRANAGRSDLFVTGGTPSQMSSISTHK